MFTGIIQGTAKVIEILEKQDFRMHTIEIPGQLIQGLKPGDSVAQNGCCLTVVSINENRVSFDLMQETLRLTNLGQLQVGDAVNVERAARFGDEIGGHQMSGHILCTAEIVDIRLSENNCQIWLELPVTYQHYLFEKGYIGVDGISLTLGEVAGNRFSINLIPETLNRTTISRRSTGERVNIEIDPQTQAIVDTVERTLATPQFFERLKR